MSPASNWKTRFGIYLAAMGTAFGLGNLWRFPYIVGENGGGAFVLLYTLVALIVGLPLMIGELTLGRLTGRPVVPAAQQVEAIQPTRRWSWVGYGCFGLAITLLAYYSVISGWVLYFVVQFLKLSLSGSAEGVALAHLTGSPLLQTGLTSVHLIFAIYVVGRGVQEGIERSVGALMPIFSLLVLALMFKSLTLATSADAMRFLFYPNFASLSLSSLSQAIGHVLFTLGLGFGMMVTFGSYMRESDHVPTVGFRITLIDTLLSIAAGLLIFPIALSASNVPLTDPGLMFQALPEFFLSQSFGVYFGLVFFLCLSLAALGASVGIMEVIVSNLIQWQKFTRQKASLVAGALVLGLSFFPIWFHALPLGPGDVGLLEILDSVLVDWLMPVAALFLCLIYGHGLGAAEVEGQFRQHNKVESLALYPHWRALVRWGIPGLIIAGLLLRALDNLFA